MKSLLWKGPIMESPEKSVERVENSSTEEERPPSSSVAGRISAVVLVLLFAGASYEAYSLGIGSPDNPGPGLWPFFVSSIAVVLSLVLVVRGTSWNPSEAGTYKWSGILALAICGYMLMLPVLGFLGSTALLCLVVTRVLGGASWVTTIATSVTAPLLSYLIFNQMLGVPAIGPVVF
ncbi:tripartite tricarboxylate transporter TctB family protein [Nocardiopsis oceani]